MAKKAKKTARGKRPKSVLAKAWATRRTNALLKAAADDGVNMEKAQPGWKLAEVVDTDTANDNRRQQGRAAAVAEMRAERAGTKVREAFGSEMTKALAADAPGQGEIVGGTDDALTAKLMKLARKKGGDVLVKSEIMHALATARFEGRNEADKLATKRLIETQERMKERVVCGFIAEIDALQQASRGLPPGMMHFLNSHTIICIVDALNKAGYHGDGKR